MHQTYQNWRHEAELEDFLLGPNPKTPNQEIPQENGTMYVECSIMRNVMASAIDQNWEGYLKTIRNKLL